MSEAQNNTPTENLIETVAYLLVEVGGYKDAALAVQDATNLIDSITGDDTDLAGQGLEAFRNLAIRADGASNLILAVEQDDADQTVRFVADEGETLPEGPVAQGPQSFEDLLASIFGPNVQLRTLKLRPQDVVPHPTSDGDYIQTPFGFFKAA